ncbi:hypothetical protein Tco_1340701, partial [Tanacetum coccineum]
WRVEESEVSGWLDRLTRSILEVAGKISPENFSGGGAVVAAVAGGGGRPPVGMRGRERYLESCYAMAVNEKLLLYHVHQFLRENNLVLTLRRGDHGEALGILFKEGNTFRHVYHGILGMNFLFVMDLVVEVLETVLVVRV